VWRLELVQTTFFGYCFRKGFAPELVVNGFPGVGLPNGEGEAVVINADPPKVGENGEPGVTENVEVPKADGAGVAAKGDGLNVEAPKVDWPKREFPGSLGVANESKLEPKVGVVKLIGANAGVVKSDPEVAN